MIETSISTLHAELDDYLGRVEHNHERVLVTRNGKPAVAIVPLEDLELLRATEDRFDLAEAEDALREADETGYIAWSDVRNSLG